MKVGREGCQTGVFTNKGNKDELRLARKHESFQYEYQEGHSTEDHTVGRSKQRWFTNEPPSTRMSPTGICYLLSVVPAIVLTYLQLFLNLLMVAMILNATLRFARILSNDLDKHINVQESRLLGRVVECTREFLRNRCAMENLPPALEGSCDVWQACMNQDTRNIMKSKETAAVLAEILNNFFGSLSDRTMYCSGGLLVGSVLLANIILTWSRRRLHVR